MAPDPGPDRQVPPAPHDTEAGSTTAPWLSVIIPTLNEAGCLGATLDALAGLPGLVEVLVVDGGSGDGTQEIARRRGVTVLQAARGRGAQLGAGAAVARGDVLWFLHADTRPPADAVERIAEALRGPGIVGGCFTIRFHGREYAARFLSWLYPHLAWLGLSYGDAAVFARRSVYQAVGGFRPLPLFEDLDLLRRLKRRGRFVRLAAVVTTSSRRFRGRSFLLTFARWSLLQVLYWLGVPPHRLARLYAHVR
jgi:rSAM/selenodomain-associated transferase 2